MADDLGIFGDSALAMQQLLQYSAATPASPASPSPTQPLAPRASETSRRSSARKGPTTLMLRTRSDMYNFDTPPLGSPRLPVAAGRPGRTEICGSESSGVLFDDDHDCYTMLQRVRQNLLDAQAQQYTVEIDGEDVPPPPQEVYRVVGGDVVVSQPLSEASLQYVISGEDAPALQYTIGSDDVSSPENVVQWGPGVSAAAVEGPLPPAAGSGSVCEGDGRASGPGWQHEGCGPVSFRDMV